MSWDKILEASFKGAVFHVQGVDNDWRRRVVAHSYPNRDGANLEDLGRDPLSIRMRAVVFGPTWRAERSGLMDAFETGTSGELVHPLLGTINAELLSVREVADDTRANFIALDLEFKEDQVDTIAFLVSLDTPQAAMDQITAIGAAASLELESVEGGA